MRQVWFEGQLCQAEEPITQRLVDVSAAREIVFDAWKKVFAAKCWDGIEKLNHVVSYLQEAN